MNKRTLIFELDGTLVDSAAGVRGALNRTLARLGRRPHVIEEVRPYIGKGARVTMQRALALTGDLLADAGINALTREFLEDYARNPVNGSSPYPGVPETLAELKRRGILLGICTNKPQLTTAPVLAAFDLARHFDAIVCGDQTPWKKPHGQHLLETIARAGGDRARRDDRRQRERRRCRSGRRHSVYRRDLWLSRAAAGGAWGDAADRRLRGRHRRPRAPAAGGLTPPLRGAVAVAVPAQPPPPLRRGFQVPDGGEALIFSIARLLAKPVDDRHQGVGQEAIPLGGDMLEIPEQRLRLTVEHVPEIEYPETALPIRHSVEDAGGNVRQLTDLPQIVGEQSLFCRRRGLLVDQ